MPDDLIHCPACNFQLRLPHELYGSPVECPQCHTRFTAPVPAVRPVAPPPPGREYEVVARPAEDDYYRPPSGGGITAAGVALLIMSALSILFSAYMTFSFFYVQKHPAEFDRRVQQMIDQNQDWDAQEKASVRDGAEWIRDNGVAVFSVELALNLITLLGAILMLGRRGYPVAVLGCLLALNPTNCPGCLLQAPFGIWGLVALLSASGRRAFQ